MRNSILTILFLFILISPAYCATEDFTTFAVLADEDSDMTRETSKVTFTTMRNDANTYTGKDYGAGHFTTFSHTFYNNLSTFTSGSKVLIWGVGNNATGSVADFVAGDDGIWIYAFFDDAPSPDEVRFYLVVGTAATDSSDYYYSADFSNDFYWTVARDESTITAKLYSDAGRTTLKDTLSVTYDSSSFRYLYVASSSELGGAYASVVSTGYVENLDLNEGGATRRIISIE